jgi:hypothetical protein
MTQKNYDENKAFKQNFLFCFFAFSDLWINHNYDMSWLNSIESSFIGDRTASTLLVVAASASLTSFTLGD